MISIKDFSTVIAQKKFFEGRKHVETMQEYSSRGGKITVIRPKIKIWKKNIVNPKGARRMRLSNKRTSDKQTAENVLLNKAFFKLHYLHGKS